MVLPVATYKAAAAVGLLSCPGLLVSRRASQRRAASSILMAPPAEATVGRLQTLALLPEDALYGVLRCCSLRDCLVFARLVD